MSPLSDIYYKTRQRSKTDILQPGEYKDLSELILSKSSSVFAITAVGDSMINAGINSGDHLLVDTKEPISDGKVVVCTINNKALVKRIKFHENRTELISENDKYPAIELENEHDLTIWGVVISVIKNV